MDRGVFNRGARLSATLLIARLVLAGVFAVAGAAKLADRPGTRVTLERFGVRPALAVPAALALPLGEFAIAAALLPRAVAPWAAAAAAVLIACFCLALARLLHRGETPGCNCFGTLRAAPISSRTLTRNVALGGLAVLVAVGGGGRGISVGGLDTRVLLGVVAAAVAAHVLFSWQLFAQNGRLHARLEALEGGARRGLDLGTPAPEFAVADLDGRSVTLDELIDPARGVLLVFSDPGCAHCTPLLPAIAAAQSDGGVPVEMISAGGQAINRARAAEHGFGRILLQDGFEVSERYRLFGAPAAVLVDGAGRIASGAAEGRRAVSELLATHAGAS